MQAGEGAKGGVLAMTLKRLLRRGAAPALEKVLAKARLADVAALWPRLLPHERALLVDALGSDARRAELLAALPAEDASALVRGLPVERAAAILRHAGPDDVADVLGTLDDEAQRAILGRLEARDAGEVEGLLRYDEASAGGIMSLRFFALPRHTTVREAIEALQRSADAETASYVYVINEFGHLVGVVSLRRLVTAKPELQLDQIMETDVVTVRPDVHQEEVARRATRYGFLAMPVVDEANKLLGIVTIDDVIDVLAEEATEDILRLAGAPSAAPADQPLWRGALQRAPWLLATAVGGTAAAALLRGASADLARTLPLVFLLPVVLGLSRNVGIQSATIVLAGLQGGRIAVQRLGRVLLGQLAVGLLLGVASAALVGTTSAFGLRALGERGALGVGGVVATALAGSMTAASVVGALFPMGFARLGVDPAVATGPLVAAAVDVAAVAVYVASARALP